MATYVECVAQRHQIHQCDRTVPMYAGESRAQRIQRFHHVRTGIGQHLQQWIGIPADMDIDEAMPAPKVLAELAVGRKTKPGKVPWADYARTGRGIANVQGIYTRPEQGL